MADQLDLLNRDPHNMNHFIQVEFDDTLGEPTGTHSSDWYVFCLCIFFSKSYIVDKYI